MASENPVIDLTLDTDDEDSVIDLSGVPDDKTMLSGVQSSQVAFELLELPIELRFIIYSFAMEATVRRPELCYKHRCRRRRHHRETEYKSQQGISMATALLQTCKQIYEEASPISWRARELVAGIEVPHACAECTKLVRHHLQSSTDVRAIRNARFAVHTLRPQDTFAVSGMPLIEIVELCTGLRLLSLVMYNDKFEQVASQLLPFLNQEFPVHLREIVLLRLNEHFPSVARELTHLVSINNLPWHVELFLRNSTVSTSQHSRRYKHDHLVLFRTKLKL